VSAGGCLCRPLPGMGGGGGKLPLPNCAPIPVPFQSCTRRPAKRGLFDYVTPIFIGNTKQIDLWSEKKTPPITPRLARRWSFDYVPANGFGGGVNSGPGGRRACCTVREDEGQSVVRGARVAPRPGEVGSGTDPIGILLSSPLCRLPRRKCWDRLRFWVWSLNRKKVYLPHHSKSCDSAPVIVVKGFRIKGWRYVVGIIYHIYLFRHKLHGFWSR